MIFCYHRTLRKGVVPTGGFLPLITPPTGGSDAEVAARTIVVCDEDVDDDTKTPPAAPDVVSTEEAGGFEDSAKGCLMLLSSSRQIGYNDRSGSSSGFPADRIRFPLTFCRVIRLLRNFLPRRNFSW